MKTKAIVYAFLAFIVLTAFAARWAMNSGEPEQEMMASYQNATIQDIPLEKWNLLAGKTIYFGHMSVGLNIIDGIKDVIRENPNLSLTVTEMKDASQMPPNGFCHALLGHNASPLEKIDAFQSQMMGLQRAPDIAFMKFCYVDFYAGADVPKIFDAYQRMIAQLQTKFPDTVFMHCTVPLTAGPQTAKRRVKELLKKCLGKPTSIDDNWIRMEFSDLIHKTYPPETIFDLARLESTTSEGIQYFRTMGAARIPFLCEKFSSDGGHLNEVGRKHVAEQLLVHLVNYNKKGLIIPEKSRFQ